MGAPLQNAIEIRGLTKAFGPKVAVRNLDLDIPQGSLYGFIGPNGAGKTTTIRMIMSIIFPDKGTLSVLGKSSAVESKDRIGYLPEERGVYRKMKVGSFLNLIAKLKGVDSAAADKKVRAWLDRLQLADCYRKKCEELSKGMQQKVQFISAVLHEPELIILDEPFSGLDPVNRRLLRELIDEQNQAGRTLIFSTHAMFEAEQLCDRLFMINKGDKVLDLPLAEVWNRYDPRAVIIEPIDASTLQQQEIWSGFEGVREALFNDGHVELKLSDGVDPSRIMSEVASRVPFRRMEVKRPSLEDVFIELVGGSAAALLAESEEFRAPTPASAATSD